MSKYSSSTDSSSDGPSQLGQYEVTGRIGHGSFGVVYKGRDPYLKRDVAIKVCTVDDDKLRQRFYREAEIAGKLEHDHVVAVHAFGFEDEAPYLVQEFLEGQDLSHLVRERVAWSGERKLQVLSQIAAALAYAHDQGVIHRDVKPANVRVLSIDPEVKVKLMDFGIAKLAHDESQLTQKGVTMGTASYLPPEQVKGGDVDHRGDIFAFGVLAYELFTMERPFRGQTLSALVYQILYKAPRKLEDVWTACPPELSQWVHKCLQKDPISRFADFHEVLEALAPIQEGAAAGRWPSLSEVWLPYEKDGGKDVGNDEGKADAASSAEVEVESPQPARSRDSSSAFEDSVGSQTQVMRPGSARKVDFDATQPVRADTVSPNGTPDVSPNASSGGSGSSGSQPGTGSGTGVGEPPALEAVDAAATRRVPMPAIPKAADGTGTEVPEELRTSAHEISKLVEAGELEAAMAQLESTIHRQRGIAKSAGVTDALPVPPAQVGEGPAEIDGERPTVEIPRATTEAARARGPAPPPPPPAAPDPQLDRPPGAVPSTRSASTTGLPLRVGGGKGKLLVLIGAFAVAAVLAVVMGWWLAQGRGEKPAPVVEMPPAPVKPQLPPQTGLVVQSTPWAVVTEVSNADGYVIELPEDPSTPLYLPLEPGEYTVIVRYTEGNDEQRCEVQVTAEQSATCVTPFTQPTASDYFKDAGWWR